MKKRNLAVLFSLSIISSQGFALCSYDLEGFLFQPDTPDAQKFPTVSGQKVSYNILNSSNRVEYSANHSALKIKDEIITEGGLALPQSGVIGFELNTEIIPTELTNSSKIIAAYGVFAQDKNKNIHSILITYTNNTALSYKDNKKNVLMVIISSTDPNTKQSENIYGYGLPVDGISQQNLGIYFNQNSNQVGLIVNKNNLGYVATLPTKPKDFGIGALASYEGFEANSLYLNKTMSLELVTAKSKFTNAFPSGTTDACGS